jgi:hypothetical protein
MAGRLSHIGLVSSSSPLQAGGYLGSPSLAPDVDPAALQQMWAGERPAGAAARGAAGLEQHQHPAAMGVGAAPAGGTYGQQAGRGLGNLMAGRAGEYMQGT